MNLLVCTTEYFPHGGGIANVAYNVVEQLKGKGVECTVCSPTGPDIKIGSQSLIQKTGIGGMLDYWYQVSLHFENNNYDVVWLQNPFIFNGNPFRRCLVTMHSTYYGSSTRGIGNLPFHLYKTMVAHVEHHCLTRMPRNTLFTGVGQPVCEELEKIGIAKDRISYVPNGVDTKRFRPSFNKKLIRNRLGIPEDDLILLSVGRLTPAKQPSTMIEVFSHLEKELDGVTLCIAGKGELFEATRNLAEKKGLRKVIFLGHVDHDRELPDLYACSDYYIMTSKYEGTPLTLLEAMASGLPCIVSDIPNLGIVRDTDCGIILNFGDVSSASDQILDYISNGHPNHSQNARRYALEQLDWHLISEQYLSIFREI